MLLYGQTGTDIARLTVDHVERRDDGLLLRLGDDPCVLPGSVACLLVELIDSRRRGFAAVGAPVGQRWLFPGSYAGRHLTPAHIHRRINRLGIFVRDARNVALLNLAVDVPVGVLADMLGVTANTASRWAQSAGGGWADRTAGRLATFPEAGL